MNPSSHDRAVVCAVEHMIRQHGRNAADFADFRSRELRALGNAEASALWAQVARRIRETESAPHEMEDAGVA